MSDVYPPPVGRVTTEDPTCLGTRGLETSTTRVRYCPPADPPGVTKRKFWAYAKTCPPVSEKVLLSAEMLEAEFTTQRFTDRSGWPTPGGSMPRSKKSTPM